MTTTQENTCAICLSNMGTDGKAVFKAECSHSFHFQCISSNVAHGNLVCPLCKCQWTELPFMAPPSIPVPFVRRPLPREATLPFYAQPEPSVFNDDDPIDPPHQTPLQEDAPASEHATNGRVEMKTFTEYPSVVNSSSYEDFAVVVHLKAPRGQSEQNPEAERAPVDLITVLDVSGSMSGAKLELLKQAMVFVIQNLGPADRLSIVSFSSHAKRLIKLTRMSSDGADLALRAVDSLIAGGGTNITEGLSKGAKILEECRQKNPVSSMILLSDGQDTFLSPQYHNGRSTMNYDALLPSSILHATGRRIPIHTFGFGTDHDSLAMHRIGEASGGTFSFIEDATAITDAFAQCIGGLLSVVSQEGKITISSASNDVVVSRIKSGRYESVVETGGKKGTIDVGELYADEQRSFLLFINIPIAAVVGPTNLLKVSFGYKDAITSSYITLEEQDVSIERPDMVQNNQICVEVEREKLRAQATEDMAEARAAADRGAMNEAVGILENRQRQVTASALIGDSSVGMLQQELSELQTRMSTRAGYEKSGRAYALSGISAYTSQRATARSSSTTGDVMDYQTPAMLDMRRKSQTVMLNRVKPSTGGSDESGSGSGSGAGGFPPMHTR